MADLISHDPEVPMPLSRSDVIDAAIRILNAYGLESLSMRRLAAELGVQPGAIYWHVTNKQDLLASIAEQVVGELHFADDTTPSPITWATTVATRFRTALLGYRDGAQIVTLAQALTDEPLSVRKQIAHHLGSALSPERAAWAAAALTHYILGYVSQEQSQADLTRAGLREMPMPDAHTPPPEFLFAVTALLTGAMETDRIAP